MTRLENRVMLVIIFLFFATGVFGKYNYTYLTPHNLLATRVNGFYPSNILFDAPLWSYELNLFPLNWASALSYCETNGAKHASLATFDSREELMYVGYATNNRGTPKWIGVSRALPSKIEYPNNCVYRSTTGNGFLTPWKNSDGRPFIDFDLQYNAMNPSNSPCFALTKTNTFNVTRDQACVWQLNQPSNGATDPRYILPNNTCINEYCVEMGKNGLNTISGGSTSRYTGDLNDNMCSDAHAFICKQPYQGTVIFFPFFLLLFFPWDFNQTFSVLARSLFLFLSFCLTPFY